MVGSAGFDRQSLHRTDRSLTSNDWIMNEETLQDLIALGEGFTSEFKQSVSRDLGREICAFANAPGGVVLIGVDDNAHIVGVSDHNRLSSQVQSIARSADPAIAVEVASVGEVLMVTVPEQHGKPYAHAGRFYIRKGASSQQMAREEIREFFFREGLIRLDESPCRSFDPEVEITPERWSTFSRRAGVSGDLDPMTVLENLHLVKDGMVTHAGAWLLADDIYGSVIGYLQGKLNSALIPHALGRDERLELPESALREAVVNAIAHRDYRSTANVQVYVFHDRLEIVTPGGLPAGMREEDLGSRSVPRNPLLFSILYRMGLVEQIGSGIRRIREVCLEYGVAEPVIDVSPDWLTVRFPRQFDTSAPHVTPHEALHVTLHVGRLLSVLSDDMARAELMQALGLKDRSHFSRTYLQPGLDAGLIEMTIPDRPRSRMQRYRPTAHGMRLRDAPPDAIA